MSVDVKIIWLKLNTIWRSIAKNKLDIIVVDEHKMHVAYFLEAY